MKKFALFIVSALAVCLIPLAHTDDTKADNAINGITVTKISNNSAKIKIKDGKYIAIEIDKHYDFPITIKSGRAQVFLEFSKGNTAKLLPRTTLLLSSPKVRHPKLRLLTGTISLELDKFPKDHKMEVVTPTAVCGAIGTHFEVSYSGEAKQQGAALAERKHSQSFKCSKGEVYVQTDSFRIGNVKKGLEVIAEAHKGKENSYCSVELKRGTSDESFKLKMHDGTELLATKDTSFELAHTRDKSIAVIKFSNDAFEEEGMIWDSKHDVKAGTSFVKVGGKYMEHKDSDNYLAAAKVEGRLDTQVREIETKLLIADDAEKIQLEASKKDLEAKRDAAATKASAIVKRFQTNQNIRRVIDKVRKNIQRQRMRRQK